jgi:hypothetical protein
MVVSFFSLYLEMITYISANIAQECGRQLEEEFYSRAFHSKNHTRRDRRETARASSVLLGSKVFQHYPEGFRNSKRKTSRRIRFLDKLLKFRYHIQQILYIAILSVSAKIIEEVRSFSKLYSKSSQTATAPLARRLHIYLSGFFQLHWVFKTSIINLAYSNSEGFLARLLASPRLSSHLRHRRQTCRFNGPHHPPLASSSCTKRHTSVSRQDQWVTATKIGIILCIP